MSEQKSAPEVADAIALIRAHLHGDTEAIAGMYRLVNAPKLVELAMSVLIGAVIHTNGVIEVDSALRNVLTLDRALEQWQQRYAAGLEG